MNEKEFVSLCKGSSYYCSVKQQKESLKKLSRYPLSLSTPVYIHLFMESGPHSTAVQISINPFSLEEYPKQTFFHSAYRYSLCCGKAPQDIVATAVKERVQKVSDAFYQPGYWDFSHDQYVTVDASSDGHKISKASCLHATKSRLCEYIQATYTVPPTSNNQTASMNTEEDEVNEPESDSDCGQTSMQSNYRSHLPRIHENPLRSSADFDTDKPHQVHPENHYSQNKVQSIIEKAAKKIRRGLKNLGQARTLPQPSYDLGLVCDRAKHYEDYFWAQASQTETTFQKLQWSSRFLASCFRLIRVGLEVEDETGRRPNAEENHAGDDRTRRDWQAAAEVINSLVNGLLKTWGWKAFLVYSALESTNFNFSACSRLSWDIREDIISGLVKILGDDVPTVSRPSTLLDPAFLVSDALNMNYQTVCTELKLDAAQTVKINAQKFRWESQNALGNLATEYKILSSAPDRISDQPKEAFNDCGDNSTDRPSILGSDRNSINALLNPEVPTQGQHSSSVSPLFQDTNGVVLDGDERDVLASKQAEIGSRGERRGLESPVEVDGSSSKRRRVDTFRSLSLSQPSNEVEHAQSGVIGNLASMNANIRAGSQKECARQPVDVVNGDALNSSIGGTNGRRGREIEFAYSNPQKDKLDSNFEEPFHNPIMARFQSDMESHQQCIMVMFPRDWEQDITFSITVDRKAGFDIIEMFDLQSLPQVQSPRGWVQPFSNMPIERLNLLGPSLHEGTVRTGIYRSASGSRCSCVHAFLHDVTDDDDNIRFSIMVDWDSGLKFIHMLGLQRIRIR